MKKLGIEYVCTANMGRSTMAESSGKDYVIELGLDDKIKIYSSGSHYEALQIMDMAFSYLVSNLEMGLERDYYSNEQKDKVMKILEKKEKTEKKFQYDKITQIAVKTLAKITEDILAEEEERFRDLVLKEVGLEYNSKPKQYKPRKDIQLVLPMKESNAEKVKELSDPTIPQLIAPLRKYVGLEGDILNPFGKGIEVWKETRDSIIESVKISVDKAIKDYL